MRPNILTQPSAPEADQKPAFKPFVLPSPELHETSDQPSNIIPATFAVGREFAAPEVSSPLLANHTSAELVNLLHEVTEAANVARPGRVELDLKLDGGNQLHIKIDWVDGQLKMTFRSPSEGLRTALENAWSGFRQEATASGLPVAEVRFEGGASSNPSFSDHSSSRGDRQAEAATPWGEQTLTDRRSREQRRERSGRSSSEDATVWA